MCIKQHEEFPDHTYAAGVMSFAVCYLYLCYYADTYLAEERCNKNVNVLKTITYKQPTVIHTKYKRQVHIFPRDMGVTLARISIHIGNRSSVFLNPRTYRPVW
jgi:hypothetical protein